MRPLQNPTRFDHTGETSFDNRHFGRSEQNNSLKELIVQANTIDLSLVLKLYNIHIILDHEENITCPFYFHSGGKERTPSFRFYPKTNSFYCWGCKNGGGTTKFYALMEDLSDLQAAQRLLSHYSGDDDVFITTVDLNEDFIARQELLLFFSQSIRNFIKNNNSFDSLQYAEKICQVFDQIQKEKPLDINGLKALTNKLLSKLV